MIGNPLAWDERNGEVAKKVPQEKLINRTKHRAIYSSVLAFVTLLRFLPRRAAHLTMRGMGWSAFYLMKSKRLRALRQLEMAFGHEKSSSDIHRIARQVFANFGGFAADALLIPRLMDNGIHKLITAEGFEHLDGLARSNQGAILLTAHFGNWELLGAWLAKRGYKVKVIGAPNKNPWINRMIADARNRAGYHSIERGNRTREILRAFAAGYSIGVLIDEDTKVDGVFVKFFKQWTYTPVGPIRLALKYGLKIIPVFIRLKSDRTYHIEMKNPLPLVCTGDKSRDMTVNTQMCSDVCEEIIRQCPDQWLWMMKRWKRQPAGGAYGNRHEVLQG